MLKLDKLLLKSLVLLTMFAFLLLSACKGSETREKVDDTVEELAGKKKVDQMKKMEGQINKVSDRQAEKIEELEEID